MTDFVEVHRKRIFETARDDILSEVKSVPSSVGVALTKPLQDLAFKVNSLVRSTVNILRLTSSVYQIEINVSVLWESTRKDAPQRAVRDYLLRSSDEVLQQVSLWKDAACKKEQELDRTIRAY
jgi:hypothetical protein